MRKRVLMGAGACVVLAAPLLVTRPWDRHAPAPERVAAARVANAEEGEGHELPPALARKLATMARFAPEAMANLEEHAGGFAMQDWIEHATPGTTIPMGAFDQAHGGWTVMRARAAERRLALLGPARAAWDSDGSWVPLGPTNGVNPDNPYRDRSVYNAGTENFSGRTIAAEIDPRCERGDCRLWIANAGGGVWRTANALAREPRWEFISEKFGHNNVAALALDPNDRRSRTLWAGTGEPNACGSGCTAGVGLYLTKNGGDTWKGPIGAAHFKGRAVGSIAVQPGNSDVVFAASGRGVLGVSNTCCGGVDALIPGAPHFGMYRSLDGGASWELVHQGAPALCTASTPDQVSLTRPRARRGAPAA
jgi:hypothetical protein